MWLSYTTRDLEAYFDYWTVTHHEISSPRAQLKVNSEDSCNHNESSWGGLHFKKVPDYSFLRIYPSLSSKSPFNNRNPPTNILFYRFVSFSLPPTSATIEYEPQCRKF